MNTMNNSFNKVKDIIEKQINFDNVNVEFKQNRDETMKISIKNLSIRNPILKSTLQASVISNVSNQIPKEKIEELHSLWKEREKNKMAKENCEKKFRDIVIETMSGALKVKLNSEDLPTSIFPTSVALSEIPNYYIMEPQESYTLTTKFELLNKLADSLCGRCGERTYGLYIPEDGFVMKEILKNHVPDFSNINIESIVRIGRINLREIYSFEYLFYLLDIVLQEMYRRNIIPDFQVELFVVEGIGRKKKFFSHYIIPNLSDIFYKLYHGDNKYSSSGISKIKHLISSFLVENWKIENNLKENNSDMAHAQINRFLYYLFSHKRLDFDSIIFLEDLKIKLGDTTPILFLEEVISWM